MHFEDRRHKFETGAVKKVTLPEALHQILDAYNIGTQRPLNLLLERGKVTLTLPETAREGGTDKAPRSLLARIAGLKAKLAKADSEVKQAQGKFLHASIEARREIQMFVDLRRREMTDMVGKIYTLEREFVDEELATYMEGAR
jgi:hypothetical protein